MSTRRLKSSPLPQYMTDYVGAFHYSDGKPIDCTAVLCPLNRSSVSPACGVHTLFEVNICGCGQFAIDLLAHLGFKRMVSCSFRDKRMRLKTRAYGISLRIPRASKSQNCCRHASISRGVYPRMCCDDINGRSMFVNSAPGRKGPRNSADTVHNSVEFRQKIRYDSAELCVNHA